MYYLTSVVLILLISFSINDIGASSDSCVRRTNNGWIIGQRERSRANSSIEYLSFKGIPYGRPPVGKLRFQDPQPALDWKGLRDATKAAERCVQFDQNFMGPNVVGSEDCLHLDVYIPITARGCRTKMPVMFWIHGGNFVFLTTNITGPDYFMEKPVIIVEVEYRLNVFGFLSTLDENAYGNAGLKDQLLALQWVQKNIAYFNGDPKQVTIFGESAGGASVLYHMLSTKSRGLFARAISESGSPLDRWAMQRQPKQNTLKLATGLGIESNDTKVIVEKLQQVSRANLLKAAYNMSIIGFYTPYYAQPFSAMVEAPSKAAFISEYPYKLLERGEFARVPFILGVNTEEGSYGYDYIVGGQVDINLYQQHPELLIPPSMNIPNDSACVNRTVENITKRYFPDGNYTNKRNWVNYESFDLFVTGILQTKEMVYRKIPTYFYVFSYVGSRTIGYIGGVGHHEELRYLWYPNNSTESPVESESDTFVRKRFVTIWTNFAATGNPTPREDETLKNVQWPLVDSTNKYLDLGFNLTVRQGPYDDDYNFWVQQYSECGVSDP